MPTATPTDFPHPPHAVDLLREQAKVGSRRDFIARGANTSRCPSCLMAVTACFCAHRHTATSPIHFTLLYHNTEIHKPTNSGRLIADLFPQQTLAFMWSRTEPDQTLLHYIQQHGDQLVILFPETEKRLGSNTHLSSTPAQTDDTPLHVIVLDATWRLASKMLHQSRWLDAVPTYGISQTVQRSFMARNAKHDNQFATAEVAAMLLTEQGFTTQGEQLNDYYRIFNQHSILSRRRGSVLPKKD